MTAHLRPARVIEVGSGYSTALALDEAEASREIAALEITCIEPFAGRLLGLLSEADRRRITLLRKPVQDVDPATYGRLGPGDVLFVDSTHVVKAGSDVVWLFLHVLPRLAAGVVVHVHDVFWPFEYPAHWLEQRRDWTEALPSARVPGRECQLGDPVLFLVVLAVPPRAHPAAPSPRGAWLHLAP